MQFALPVFESPKAFAKRNSAETDPYLGAWRAVNRRVGGVPASQIPRYLAGAKRLFWCTLGAL
jgi:hypothetical protein